MIGFVRLMGLNEGRKDNERFRGDFYLLSIYLIDLQPFLPSLCDYTICKYCYYGTTTLASSRISSS